jgi:hypothetical protein
MRSTGITEWRTMSGIVPEAPTLFNEQRDVIHSRQIAIRCGSRLEQQRHEREVK